MNSQFLSCKICNEVFNQNERKPLILPCGYTFCESCIVFASKINNQQFKCVSCSDTHKIAMVSDLQINQLILQIVQHQLQVLENPLLQIGTLLTLGFGEACSEVIQRNIQSASGELNPMIPGKKTMAIFGFCDIRNFTDITEVLQEEVMIFVNEISEIVHSTVYKYSGFVNKNNGDQIVLVWKFPDDQIEQQGYGELKLADSHIVRQIADMSVISLLKILGEINKSDKILNYSKNQKLKERMPGFKVKLGFGLHLGWVIEGAIGSEFKIDASYLSPNVNMASRLCDATKQFGLPLLISEELAQTCSPELRDQMRQIDIVTVKGCMKPVNIFTCDLDPDCLVPEVIEQIPETQESRKNKKSSQRIQREQIRENAFDPNKNMPISSIILTDPDLQKMRTNITTQFLDQFKQGFECYIKGDWESAQRILTDVQKLRNSQGRDGPSLVILDIIQSNGGKCPNDWKGYRGLHSK